MFWFFENCPFEFTAIAGKLNREGWELEEELEQEFGIRVIGNKEREHEAEVLANYAKEVKEKEGGNAKVKLGPYSNLDEHEMEEFMGAIIPDNMDGLESRDYYTGAIIPKNMDRDANNLAKLDRLFLAFNASRRSLPLSYDARKHGKYKKHGFISLSHFVNVIVLTPLNLEFIFCLAPFQALSLP